MLVLSSVSPRKRVNDGELDIEGIQVVREGESLNVKLFRSRVISERFVCNRIIRILNE